MNFFNEKTLASIHLILDNKIIGKPRLKYVPRVGEIIRHHLGFLIVKTIVYCFDEVSDMGQRINIEVEKEK